ncbi:hypothetical protein VN97_g10134, partial [Penicillium thymicola]
MTQITPAGAFNQRETLTGRVCQPTACFTFDPGSGCQGDRSPSWGQT